MKILISGSVRNENFEGSIDTFQKACEKIGTMIAQNGHAIIVGSDDPETADLHVVKGYCAYKENPDLQIFAYRGREDQVKPYKAIRDASSHVHFTDRQSPGHWEVNRVEQISTSDCVLLIGGGKGTLQAGLVAPTLEKPVVAVSCFNGSAKEVWDRIESRYNANKQIIENANKLKEEWVDGNERYVLNLLQIIKFTNPYKRKSFLPDIAYLTTVLIMFSGWLYFFYSPLISNTISLFILMGISSILGTTVKNGLPYSVSDNDIVRWDKIFMETGSALAIGLGLTWIYFLFNGTLTGKLDFTALNEIKDFQRISVFMSVVGLYSGFSLTESSDNLIRLLSKSISSIGK